MEYIEIDVNSTQNDFLMRAMLDGEQWTIHMSFNATGSFWTLAFEDSVQNAIAQIGKLVPNFPVNLWHISREIPQGVLWVRTSLDTIGKTAFSSGDATLCYCPVANL